MKRIIIILGLLILGCEATTAPVDRDTTGYFTPDIPGVYRFKADSEKGFTAELIAQTISLQITIAIDDQFKFIKKVNRLCRRFSYGNNTIEIYPTSYGFDLAFTTTHFVQFWNKLAKLCQRHAIGDFRIEQRTTH